MNGALLSIAIVLAVLVLLTIRIDMKLSEALAAVGELEASLDEASTEILAELEKLRTTDPDLSAEGAALIERVRGKARGLADIIPNAEPPTT